MFNSFSIKNFTIIFFSDTIGNKKKNKMEYHIVCAFKSSQKPISSPQAGIMC